jgi:hypothetical protein
MSRQPIRWKLGALAGLAVVVVTSIPQVTLWINRGREWQGSYAFTDPDELAYSAYLNSLIEGAPRLNNPYLGRYEPRVATGENLFSIQFLPPYAVVLLARMMGLSASTAFILLIPIIAFASAMAVYWVLLNVTGAEGVAAAGAMIILLCGVLVSESPFSLENHYGGFAFLRRYIPAVPFPLFFMFCTFVWRALVRRGGRALLWSFLGGVAFGLLVYSYFYLWTAACAWLFCLTVMWLLARPEERSHVLKCISTFCAVAVIALIPYFYLLAHRTGTIDRTQALVLTHAPDVFRLTEITGVLILLALAWRARRGTVDWKSPVVLFAASCAATPFIVFNQHVITGRSLQSFHYEQFIVNYLLLVGLVVTYKLIWWRLRIRPAWWIALALIVGLTTSLKVSSVESNSNRSRDEAIPVFDRIQADARSNQTRGVAIFDDILLAASAPTSSSFGILWSPHMYTFGTTSTTENVERFYQYLYYMGVDARRFETMLKEKPLPRAAVFGLYRVNSKLSIQFDPVSAAEISAQVEAYSAYVHGFSHEQAMKWPLSYVILVDGDAYDWSNLDRWYERDGGERIGGSVLYSVRLRPAKETEAKRPR